MLERSQYIVLLIKCHTHEHQSFICRPRIEPQQPQHHQQHQQHPHQDGIGKDEPPPPPLDLVPPRFIEVQKGKISLAPVAKPLPPPPPSPSPPPTFDAAAKDKVSIKNPAVTFLLRERARKDLLNGFIAGVEWRSAAFVWIICAFAFGFSGGWIISRRSCVWHRILI